MALTDEPTGDPTGAQLTPSLPVRSRAGAEADNRRFGRLAGLPRAAMIGTLLLATLAVVCLASLPWTLGAGPSGEARYKAGTLDAYLLPPTWAGHREDELARLGALTAGGKASPVFVLGTDKLGRDLLIRCLAGGGVSLGIGVAAACISVIIGVLWGATAGYLGGRIDALMMRTVDVLYGLPYVLLVVLLAVAGEAVLDNVVARAGTRDAWIMSQAVAAAAEHGRPADEESVRQWLRSDPELRSALNARADLDPDLRPRQLSESARSGYQIALLLVAIGGVSWLTMSRVIRGQVLSLRSQPFIEASRAMGLPAWRIFLRHLLPNLVGPIIVYATLTVPQAILQESFLSFLGIGVRPPLPSWGNLAAEGLSELNPVRVRWWLLVFPCGLLGTTLLALNLVGESLRQRFDPRSRRR